MYTTFLRAVNEAAHDSVDTNKERSIVTMQKLLQGHPEQEAVTSLKKFEWKNFVTLVSDPPCKHRKQIRRPES